MSNRNSRSDAFKYHLISDRNTYVQPLHEVAREAERAGVHFFQLREKHLGKRELLELAKHVRPALVHTKFIVNGHLDIAIASRADGVHLQTDNIPAADVRSRFPNLLIGYSAHSKEEIIEASRSGADYVLLSPIFSPISKTGYLKPLGIEVLKRWSSVVQIPVIALGGISEKNLNLIADSGCGGAAGISLFCSNGYFTSERMFC